MMEVEISEISKTQEDRMWFLSHADPRLTIIYVYASIYLYMCVFVNHETKAENEMGERP